MEKMRIVRHYGTPSTTTVRAYQTPWEGHIEQSVFHDNQEQEKDEAMRASDRGRGSRYSEKLSRVSPFGVFAAEPLQPICRMVAHPVLGPFFYVNAVGGLLDGVVRVVHSC